MVTKKGHPKFNVPNYGAKHRKRVKERWRKQRGIDNKKRVDKKFMGASPSIGYRNPERLRGTRQDGMRTVLVSNMNELRSAIEEGANVSVILASSLSTRKKAELSKLAFENEIHVINPPKGTAVYK
ncbi:MAG: eL32 family ribosomal protein [Candidatus Micrarchaeia archaeon]